MSPVAQRLNILSVGRARARWPRDVARWSTAGLLPVDHHPCLGPDELDSRLAEAGRVDVVLLDGGLASIGRDLIRRSSQRGAAVLVLDDEPGDWVDLGASAVAPPPDEPESLRRMLDQLRPDGGTNRTTAEADPPRTLGRFVAVTGHGGAGTSTIAHGLARRWGAATDGRQVLLADLSLRADQHVHHDLIEPRPGVLELVAGHRGSTMALAAIRAMATGVDDTHYLLTGIRRPQDWTALPPAAVEAALTALRAAFDIVVADVDADIDGRTETGSSDLEERNGLARAALRVATAVVVVMRADLLGLHRLCRQLEALCAAGTDPAQLHIVANGARRRAPVPTSLRRDVSDLLHRPFADSAIVSVPHLTGLEARRRDGRPPGPGLDKALRGIDRALRADPVGPSERASVGATS